MATEASPFLVQYSQAYLDSKKDTLWGQAFDISDDKRREEAAHWLALQIQGVQDTASGGTR